MYQRREISFPVGYKPQNRNAISGHLLSQKTYFSFISLFSYKQHTSVPFLGAISLLTIRKWLRNLFSAKVNVLKWHHNHSQSPLFGFTVLYPHWKWNITFLVHIHLNMGMKNCIKCFFCYTFSTLWRFYWENKKSVIYSLKTPTQTSYSQDIQIMICWLEFVQFFL